MLYMTTNVPLAVDKFEKFLKKKKKKERKKERKKETGVCFSVFYM